MRAKSFPPKKINRLEIVLIALIYNTACGNSPSYVGLFKFASSSKYLLCIMYILVMHQSCPRETQVRVRQWETSTNSLSVLNRCAGKRYGSCKVFKMPSFCKAHCRASCVGLCLLYSGRLGSRSCKVKWFFSV